MVNILDTISFKKKQYIGYNIASLSFVERVEKISSKIYSINSSQPLRT